MGETSSEGPDILGAVTAGLILILIAILFVITPNFITEFVSFFQDLAATLGTWVWPSFSLEPTALHPVVYNVIYQFFFGTLIINLLVILLRVIFRDSYRRQLESVGGIIFSTGVIWAAYQLLTGATGFTEFVGYFITFIGVSVVISSLALIAVKRVKK